jgi:hypothetical protein
MDGKHSDKRSHLMNFKPLCGVFLAIFIGLGLGFSQSDLDKAARKQGRRARREAKPLAKGP